MLNIKHKNISLAILALVVLVYFATISHLEIHPFFRGEVVVIPLQLLTLVYITYWRWSRKQFTNFPP